jgi:hypothetical protein
LSAGICQSFTSVQRSTDNIGTICKKKRKENPESLTRILKTMGSKKSVFNPDEKAELVDYLKKNGRGAFGLTVTECRKLAFQLSEQNGHEHDTMTRR